MSAHKVVIGSKYDGPPYDRPALRRLPAGWVLSVETEEPPALVTLLWMAAVVGGAWLFWVVMFSLEKIR